MRLYQKIVIGILSLLAIAVTGVTVYGMRALNEVSSVVDNINHLADRESEKRDVAVKIEDRDPFSILLLGTDVGALGRTGQGRTDTMMVVTVNPENEQTTIVSLDRDILADMMDGGTFDKLNHAYAYGGVELAMDAVEKLLDIPIDHFALLNMQGLRDLIDAVGGIEVDNQIEFTLEGVHVPAGRITLDGKTGLAYARMRKDDPEGDIGRQRRQREVVTKVIERILSLDGISNYQQILRAIENNSQTDITWDQMLDIAANYYPAFNNVEQEQLEGTSQMINDIYYQILGINELLRVQNLLKEQLGLPTNETLAIDPQFQYSFNGFIGNQFFDDTVIEQSEYITGAADSSGY